MLSDKNGEEEKRNGKMMVTMTMRRHVRQLGTDSDDNNDFIWCKTGEERKGK